MNFPFLILSLTGSASSFFIKIFAVIVSVKSVTLKMNIIFSFLISLSSVEETIPSMTTSPISS